VKIQRSSSGLTRLQTGWLIGEDVRPSATRRSGSQPRSRALVGSSSIGAPSTAVHDDHDVTREGFFNA
jgi:hypothetical protein